jgi:uncharacterized membrane protein
MGALSILPICATLFLRAEEAWEPVLFGGMIPIIGALAVLYLIWRAVKDNPENDEDEDKTENTDP